MTMSPYNYFGEKNGANLDFKRMTRGRRWMLGITGDFYEKINDGGAGTDTTPTTDLMRCLVCFDVKKEDAELKEGHKGIGACGQSIGDYDYTSDGNFFGTVEAQGSDSF